MNIAQNGMVAELLLQMHKLRIFSPMAQPSLEFLMWISAALSLCEPKIT